MPITDSQRIPWFTADRLALAGLLLFTLVVRGGVLWAMRGNLEQDPDAYREIAENLVRHGEFALGKRGSDDADSKPIPTAYRPPLYPVVLSNLPTADGQQVSLVKVAVLHVLLGVATVWLTWLTARRLLASGGRQPPEAGDADNRHPPAKDNGGTPHGANAPRSPAWRSPLLAGLLVACDPILLNQQTVVMTETLAAFLAILALWCLARFDARHDWFNAALAGGTIGLAVLCRPTFLPWLGLVGLAMMVVRGGADFRFWILDFGLGKEAVQPRRRWFAGFGWRVANVAALVIVAAGVLSPWVIRNQRVFGKPVVTTTHGGYTLLLGNNELFYAWLESSDRSLPWNSKALDLEVAKGWYYYSMRRTEIGDDEAYYRWARHVIHEQPRRFAPACTYRLRQLWSPLPYKLTADESLGRWLLRYATAAWYCGVYALAAVGIWRLRWKLLRPPWIWGVLLCLAFTAVHTVYWTNLRMRAPLMPFVAIVAAAAIPSSKFQLPSSKLPTAECPT